MGHVLANARPLACAAVVVLAAGSAFAQSAGDVVAAKEVERIAEPLDFDRVGTAEGLQQSNVQAMLQDPLGFLWFGTQDGLARYDGTKMRIFRPIEDDASTISAGYITALALDSAGKMWVGTDSKGVNIYDPATDKFTRFLHGTGPHSLSSEGVNAIAKDKKDRMWLAMSGGGLNRFDASAGSFAEYLTAPLDVSILSMDVDAQGNLWLGTNEDGVIRWNPDNGSSAKYKPTTEDVGQAVNAVLVASTGKVWVGTEGNGLFQLDPVTSRFTSLRHDPTNRDSLSDDHISAIYEDKTHAIWVGTHNGLNRIDPSGKITHYEHDKNDGKSLVYPWVTSLYQDAAGVIYAGAKAGGVSKFQPLRMKFGHHRMRTATANSFFEDSDGSLWVGTYHGGLWHYEWDARRVTTYHTLGTPEREGSVQLDSGWLTQIHRDKRGTLWITTLELGLIAFDPDTENFKQYRKDTTHPGGLPEDVIWDMWEDDKGILWLATWGGGLVRFDPRAGKFSGITVDNGSGLSSNHLYRLYPDPKDPKILWIGTAKGGVVRFDLGSTTGTSFRHKGEDPTSLSSDDVTALYRDTSGVLWAGTYGGGLNRLDPQTGKAERFSTSNTAMASDVILGILPGDDGSLWMSTNGGGLVQFEPKDKKFLVYESSDGVQDNEFGQGSYFRSARSGKLFFGGVGGFNSFAAKDIARDTYLPPVVLTGLKVFNQEVKLGKPIWMLPPLELSYSDSFELQFAALSFAAPAKNRYAYKLEGFDDKFIETDRPYATYTKLDGGKYTLRVRAANEHGVWNETGLALEIKVTPPLWRTWPAFAVYIAILVGAVLLLFRLQRQKLRRLEKEGRLAVVERDLELTGAVQSGFLPNYNEYVGSRVQLFGFYRAADACSGDWWWHESLSDGRHVVLVGDVTGHGPGPAMVTAAVATAFHVLAGTGAINVEQTLELLNRVVLHVAKGKYHMTMAALELDETTGLWVFHNAGAPPILSLHNSGKHKVHFCAGTPLGTESAFEVGRVEGRLEPTERIMMYTDGIPEISLPNGNVLGIRRFAQMYERTKAQPINDAAQALAQLAEQTQAGAPQTDDWTFTLIEWR